MGKPIPLLAKEGWLRHLIKVAKPPKRRRRGGQFGAELTTPSAPFLERDRFFDGAASPPLPGGEWASHQEFVC